MPVKAVHLSADAYVVCLTHALSTEKEEIMGLLIGEISPEKVSYISAVILLRRSCKQADRVEISPEQLSAASTEAETLGHMLKRPMRVIGWYHSHPHITVWPSHIDVRTQADYQLMDDGFVGLIFSIFNHDKLSKMNRVEVSCFQSVPTSPGSDSFEREEIALHIDPAQRMSEACIRSLIKLPRILCEEESEAYARTKHAHTAPDLLQRMHNDAVYTSGMVQVDESMYRPLLETLEQRLRSSGDQMAALRQEKARLVDAIKLYPRAQNSVKYDTTV